RAQHSGAATNRFCRERNGPHHRPLDRDRPSRSNSSHFGHRHAVARHAPKCYALPERCAFENGVTRIRRSSLLRSLVTRSSRRANRSLSLVMARCCGITLKGRSAYGAGALCLLNTASIAAWAHFSPSALETPIEPTTWP